MSQFPECVVWTQTWQIAAVVCAVAVVVRVAARHRPYLSHALWLVVLLKCITPPVFCSPAGVFCWMRSFAVDSPAAVACLSRSADDARSRPTSQVLSARVRTERQSLAGLLADERRTANHAADTRPMLAPAEIEPAASPSMTRLALRILGVVWIAGTLVIFVGTSAWLVAGLRRLRRDGCRVDPALQRLTTSLARRLGMRRRVRLVVTAGRVGPAVFGLLRPTVLLPRAIVQGRPLDEIEPILAHELIHIRRGDLWVGLLQTVAQAVWWFHPGVWLAGRWIYSDAERCCDEAVVAELRCPPSRYARSLLEVLARKRDLAPLPSLPGVRPVELTSKRMERIMRLGQGCRRRSPWWCWAVMLLAAAVTLPGAARIAESSSAENPNRDREGAESNTEPKRCQRPVATAAYQTIAPAVPDMASPPLGQGSPQEPNRDRKGAAPSFVGPSRGFTYECGADDLLKAMQEEFDIDKAEARKRIESFLANAALAHSRSLSQATATEQVRFAWSGDLVTMTGPSVEAVERAAQVVDTMRRCGLSQITLDVRFVTAPSSVVDAAGVDWESQFEPVPPENTAKSPHPVNVEFAAQDKRESFHDRSRTVREKSYPIRIAMLDEKGVSRLTARLDELESRQYEERETLGDRLQQALGYQTKLAARRQRVNILQAPRVTLFSGQEGCVNDCSQSPFVVDLKTVTGPYGTANQPVIRVLDEGIQLNLRAESLNCGCVWLECRARFSHIGEVDTLTTKTTVGSEPVTIQVPEHEVTELTTNVQVAVGQTLVIDGSRIEGKDGRPVSSLVMVTATKVIPAKTRSVKTAVSKVDRKAYHVVMPIGDEDRRKVEDYYRKQGYSLVRVTAADASSQVDHGKNPLPPAKPRQDSSSKQAYYMQAYAVADLVVPIPGFVESKDVRPAAYHEALPKAKTEPDFQPLVELIQSTVRPDMWEDMGGLGTIKGDERRLMLVVNQTKEVHEEIVDLFEQLRRLRGIRVMLDVRRIDMAGDTFDKLGIELDAEHRQTTLGPREARLFWALANGAGQGRVLQFPRATCFNGQEKWFGLGDKSETHGESILRVQGTVNSGNRADVRLITGFLGEIASSPLLRGDTFPATTLPDGQTLLVDVTGLTAAKTLLAGEVGVPIEPDSKIFVSVKPDTSAQRVFLSITPRIIVAEEERITPKPQLKPPTVADVDLSMVKARVIIQEDEERIGSGVEP